VVGNGCCLEGMSSTPPCASASFRRGRYRKFDQGPAARFGAGFGGAASAVFTVASGFGRGLGWMTWGSASADRSIIGSNAICVSRRDSLFREVAGTRDTLWLRLEG
jgi:hypothetical protein